MLVLWKNAACLLIMKDASRCVVRIENRFCSASHRWIWETCGLTFVKMTFPHITTNAIVNLNFYMNLFYENPQITNQHFEPSRRVKPHFLCVCFNILTLFVSFSRLSVSYDIWCYECVSLYCTHLRSPNQMYTTIDGIWN